jgi:hypothetical protein
MRPVGRKRDYSATIAGRDFRHTSKDGITQAIRAAVYRENGGRVRFTWVHNQAR